MNRVFQFVTFLLFIYHFAMAGNHQWNVSGLPEIVNDPAVKIALDSLSNTLNMKSIHTGNKIILALDTLDFVLKKDFLQVEEQLIRENSFKIEPKKSSSEITLNLSSPKVMGLAQAIFYIEKYIRVNEKLPDTRYIEIPEFPYRFCYFPEVIPNLDAVNEKDYSVVESVVLEKFDELLKEATINGFNFVVLGRRLEYFVPWNENDMSIKHEEYRRILNELISRAHRLHLRLLIRGYDYSYLKGWLKENNALKKRENLWLSLEEKYRSLLWEVSEIDGIVSSIVTNKHGSDFELFNLLNCDNEDEFSPEIISYYKKYISTVYNVIAGEYGKLFVFNAAESDQYRLLSILEVYKAVFGPDLATENFISLIRAESDQGNCYPDLYAGIAGITPHTMILEINRFHRGAGQNFILNYLGEMYGAEAKYFAEKNIKGLITQLGYKRSPANEITLKLLSKLSKFPYSDVRRVTRDEVKIIFGKQAADKLTDILTDSYQASRDGLYLLNDKTTCSPLLDGRCFTVKGYPYFDAGKSQYAYLREIYFLNKLDRERIFSAIDRGMERYSLLLAEFNRVRYKIENKEKAESLEYRINEGVNILRLYNMYVKNIMNFFLYLEKPDRKLKIRIKEDIKELEKLARKLENDSSPFYLYGIRVFIDLNKMMFSGRDKMFSILDDSPGNEELKEMFEEAARKSNEEIISNNKSEKIATFKCISNGRDIVEISGDKFRVEHLAFGKMDKVKYQLLKNIPDRKNGRYVIKNNDSEAIVYQIESPQAGKDKIKIFVATKGIESQPVSFSVYFIPEQ